MTSPDRDRYDDVVTLRDIADALTERDAARQSAAVALVLLAAGLALGLVPVVVGEFGAQALMEWTYSPVDVTLTELRILLGFHIYQYVPLLGVLLATLVTFVASASREQTFVPAIVAGALVGCTLFTIATTGIPYTQFVPTDGRIHLFGSTVPPYDTAGVLLNGVLTGLTGSVGSLGASLAGSLLD
ncbi:hypothetical protein [Haloarchaeobius amylolyticus]|uniref:hypothetical protein n=1 Tax=Haloarchaeobius amylolyticus TaxID=1198296 RepID=UPI00226FFC3F|nr:hypothetical protein [Haloarchaeobius amylolyticus]